LTGIAGAAVYFDPHLMNNWIGPAMLGAPPASGLIFYLIARPWLKRIDILLKKEATSKFEPKKETTPVPEVTEPPVKSSTEDEIQDASMNAAAQTLSLFQREGRLIDFLQEDIEHYDDAQIGAAAREVHRGCKILLKEVFKISPVLKVAEGSYVEIEEDFDPAQIKLVGNIHGKPPFKGTLRHCGWKFTSVNLPESITRGKSDVLAPAEVEIS
jgi:hypothetical protein